LHGGWFAVSAACYLAGLVPLAAYWFKVLQAMGQAPPAWRTWRAYFVGHLGKYVPGKAMVVVLRTALVRGPGVETSVAAASVFYETLLTVAVGAALAGILLVAWPVADVAMTALAWALAAACAVPTLPPVLSWLKDLVSERTWLPRPLASLQVPGYAIFALGWMWLTVGWMFTGLSMWFTVKAAGFDPGTFTTEGLFLCVAASGLAVAAGFATLIPAGLVVREAVLLTLLAPVFGKAPALVAAILARLVAIVAELVISGILYPYAFRRDSRI
jgi:hypothetical protein